MKIFDLRRTLVSLVMMCTAISAFAGEPVCGKSAIVYLDIGHSPRVTGAFSARGKTEYSFNRRFAFVLAKQLRLEKGLRVKILNPTGTHQSLASRAGDIRQLSQGVLISVHHDSVQPGYLKDWKYAGMNRKYSDRFSGFSLFVSSQSPAFEASKALALSIGDILTRIGFHSSPHHGEPIRGENRPVIDKIHGLYLYDRLAILRKTKIPAVLIEVGIIVNREEETKLSNPQTIRTMSGAISLGISRFCR